MVSVNFIPEEYRKNAFRSRASRIYVGVFVLVVVVELVFFTGYKLRGRRYAKSVRGSVEVFGESGQRLGEIYALYRKGEAMLESAGEIKAMMGTVRQSVLLARLANNLPEGVSLTSVKIFEKGGDVSRDSGVGVNSRYNALRGHRGGQRGSNAGETFAERHVEIGGRASNDIEIAGYIKGLSGTNLFENISDVETRGEGKGREFSLTCVVKSGGGFGGEEFSRMGAADE